MRLPCRTTETRVAGTTSHRAAGFARQSACDRGAQACHYRTRWNTPTRHPSSPPCSYSDPTRCYNAHHSPHFSCPWDSAGSAPCPSQADMHQGYTARTRWYRAHGECRVGTRRWSDQGRYASRRTAANCRRASRSPLGTLLSSQAPARRARASASRHRTGNCMVPSLTMRTSCTYPALLCTLAYAVRHMPLSARSVHMSVASHPWHCAAASACPSRTRHPVAARSRPKTTSL